MVLVIVHSIVSCHRLMDVVDLIETDPRVQTVFTVGPDVFNNGVERYLNDLGALVVPWHQAVRSTFDLALSASHGGLHELHAPLALMAHGAGHGKLVRRPAHGGPPTRHHEVYGLDSQRLVRDGRVLASAIVLAHEAERDILGGQCPDALPAVVLAGDICFDKLAASVPDRAVYRQALGVHDHQKLVVVCSTWGPDGIFGRVPDLLPNMLDELSAQQFRVAALLHPAVWTAHGQRQIRAWMRDCREAGLILPQPTDDWRALVAAADYVIGDHGSVAVYAAAIGIPLLQLETPGADTTTPGSAQEFVTRHADRLQPLQPLQAQLARARPLDAGAITGMLTSRPGEASRLLRRMIYKLLRLPEPGKHRHSTAVPAPRATDVGELP